MAKVYAGNHQSGMAMLEVLIAIVVISVGLLGVAGLQIAGLRGNQIAYLRSIATAQAYDLADRMRANLLQGVKNGYYDNLPTNLTDPGCIGTTNGCSPSNWAKSDVYVWRSQLATLLPGGTGAISGSAATSYTITVSWTEKCTTGELGCGTSGTMARSFQTTFVP